MANNGFGYDIPKEKSYDYSKKPGTPKFIVDDLDVKLIVDEKGNVTGDTEAYVKGNHDLYQDIQAQKDKCGLAYILTEIANGRVNPSSLVDDVRVNGDKGGDFTRPTMKAEAYPLMAKDAENAQKLANIAKELGVSVDELLKCADINSLIQSKLAPAKQEVKQVASSNAEEKGESK